MKKAVPGEGWGVKKASKEGGKSMFGMCLCTSSELPRWHFKHRMLETGYREGPSFNDAVWSLFAWHNETVNMWTHYLGSIGLLVYIYWIWYKDYQIVTFALNSSYSYHISSMVLFNVVGNAIPIFLSAFCHQFYCIDKGWHTKCWFLDFMGILTGMLGTGITFCYLAFFCSPMIFTALLCGMLMAYALAIKVCWGRFVKRSSAPILQPADRFPEFSGILSLFGWVATVIPVAVVMYLRREYLSEPVFLAILWKSVAGPVLMGLGITFFAQGHFPERFVSLFGLKTDYFDIVGHSHQWWHVLSAILQFVWVSLCKEHFLARMTFKCSES